MVTIAPDKTPDVEVIAHQLATHPVTIKGSDIPCLTKRAVTIFMYHGYVQETADTNPGKFKVQLRPDAGGGSATEHWMTVAEFQVKGTTPDTEGMDATEPIGETVLAVTLTAGFVAEDLLYIEDTTTLIDSEWAECQEIALDASITLVDGLTVQKDSSDVIWNDASTFFVTLDLNAIESFRVVWSHEGGTGANGHIKVLAIFHDSDNSA